MSILQAVAAESAAKKAPYRVPLPEDTQRVCIDLPGEDIRCYVHKPKLQIVLRKHRDVIFDIKLFKGTQYTVEADQSDFYNARDKKLVDFKKKQKVTFTDGERMHLHVGRNFTGSLILKANGKVMGHWQPSLLDITRYDDAPETKLAPLMVIMKNTDDAGTVNKTAITSAPLSDPLGISQNWTLSPISRAYNLDAPVPLGRPATHAAYEPPHPTVAVVDVDGKTIPEHLLRRLSQGIKHLSEGNTSVLADVDTDNIVTRNWLYGQLAGTAAYAKDNWSWLRNSINKTADGSFKLVSAKISYRAGKARVYFTGYSKLNPVFGPGGHGADNAKVLQIYAGVGSTASSFKSVAKSIGGTLKANALISFIFGSALSIAEWKEDVQKDRYDLAAALFSGLIKALVSAALVAIIVAAFVVFVMTLVGGTVAAITIGVLTVVLSVATGITVEIGDKALGKKLSTEGKKYDGLASIAAPWLRDMGTSLNENWDYLKSKIPQDYQNLSFSK